tara:strand:+ start:144 stop:536 length:393 start_codon:yes stop_codon:yes gene_type:complete
MDRQGAPPGKKGGASRFFTRLDWDIEDNPKYWPSLYTPKASRRERDMGLSARNTHPTVKPLAVMRWLLSLVAGGVQDAVVIDPFAGSGTTVCAGIQIGVHVIGIEQHAEYAAIARSRVAHFSKSAVQQNL